MGVDSSEWSTYDDDFAAVVSALREIADETQIDAVKRGVTSAGRTVNAP